MTAVKCDTPLENSASSSSERGTNDEEIQQQVLAIFTDQLGAKVNAAVLGTVVGSCESTAISLETLLGSSTVDDTDVEEVLWTHLKDVLQMHGTAKVRTMAQWLVAAGRYVHPKQS